MSFGSKILGFGGFANRESTYEIEQSCMFNIADAAYLVRTPSSSSNQKTWTWSGWVKRGRLASSDWQILFSAHNDVGSTGGWCVLQFNADTLYFNAWSTNWRQTTRLFRDVSAWYHIVLAVDTTQGTADDRIKIYVNGTMISHGAYQVKNNPSQNADLGVNSAVQHRVGSVAYSADPGDFEGYMAEVHFIDGTALTPSSFGKTDSDTGEWIPKKVSGLTYGTNGFYLKFASGAIGTDSSGEGNNYTATNLADADIMLDTPTNNFATLNSIDNGDISDDLFQASLRKQAHDQAPATYWLSSGKWYCEVALLSGSGTASTYNYAIYVNDSVTDVWSGWGKNYVALTLANGGNSPDVFSVNTDTNGTVTQPTGSRPAATAIIGVAVDVDNGHVEYYINGSLNGKCLGITDWTLPLNVTLAYATSTIVASSNNQVINFGQNGTFCGNVTAGGNADGNGYGDFKYSPPTGYLAMCSKNLPTPTIKQGTDHFNTVTYTGNGSSGHAITGVGFQPSLTWIKSRSQQANHGLHDVLRVDGSGNEYILFSNDDDAGTTGSAYLSSFDSDGFTVNNNTSGNNNNSNYVAWNWKAGAVPTTDNSASAGATPTAGSVKIDGSNLGSALAGSIAATRLTANTTAGFSIVTYPGGAGTVAHGLGVAPKLVLQKKHDASGDWLSYTSAVDGTADAIRLNTNDSVVAADPATLATSTVFSSLIGGDNVIAYCFAEIENYSKLGVYTGNNSTNGPFIYTGFRPAVIIAKRTDATDDWEIIDSVRNIYNDGANCALWPGGNGDTGWDESCHANYAIDFLANGFKLKTSHSVLNASSGTYMYMALADSPFKYANAK